MPLKPRIAPSILSADFARLGAQVKTVIDAGATVIHVDVMDGHFVPPLSMGPIVVSALKDCGATLDVHLMVQRPERHVAEFAKAGADIITVHAEATPHVHYALAEIRAAGCRAGLAVNPGTELDGFAEVDVDLALCMSVNPGWGGQAFIGRSLDKLARMRALVGPEVDVEVDGGVDATTAGPAAAAGASLLVAGSAIFGTSDPGAAYAALAAAVTEAAP